MTAGQIVRQPPYMQLIERYRQDIAAGRLNDGDPLPSARELAAGYGIALATAAKVGEGLRALGLATTVPGVGSFVAVKPGALDDPAVPLTRDLLDVGRQIVATRPAAAAGADAAVGVGPAPRRIARQLGLPARARVIRRAEVTIRDGQAHASSTRWFPAGLAEAAPQLLSGEPLPATLPGLRPARGDDRIVAREAAAEEAAALGIAPGRPVLALQRWLYDAGGSVLEFTEMIARDGEHLDFGYRLARGRIGAQA
jgi:DNA-binding GntR family transcriptional regulator